MGLLTHNRNDEQSFDELIFEEPSESMNDQLGREMVAEMHATLDRAEALVNSSGRQNEYGLAA
jgi:hypothetical protein